MRFAKMLAVFVAVAALSAVTALHAADYNRFGKGPTTIGLTPPGFSTSSGSYARGRAYYAPAPVIATTPSNGERRMFSAEPSAPAAPAAPAAPSAPVTGPCPCPCGK